MVPQVSFRFLWDSRRPQDAPRQPQGVPRWPQDAPRTPKRAQEAPRRGQDGRRQRQDGPRWLQDGSRWFKMPQDGPHMASRWPPVHRWIWMCVVLPPAACRQMLRDMDRFAARRPPADALRRGSLCRPQSAADRTRQVNTRQDKTRPVSYTHLTLPTKA